MRFKAYPEFRYLMERIYRLERLVVASFEGRNLLMWSKQIADDLAELQEQVRRDSSRIGRSLEWIELERAAASEADDRRRPESRRRGVLSASGGGRKTRARRITAPSGGRKNKKTLDFGLVRE